MTRKDQKKQVFNQQKLNSPYCNLPVHTRDTAGTGSGMPRYAKVDYRTRTRVTRFGKPAGFPVPVWNPMIGWVYQINQVAGLVRWQDQLGFETCNLQLAKS